jgi:hypothetical protein
MSRCGRKGANWFRCTRLSLSLPKLHQCRSRSGCVLSASFSPSQTSNCPRLYVISPFFSSLKLVIGRHGSELSQPCGPCTGCFRRLAPRFRFRTFLQWPHFLALYQALAGHGMNTDRLMLLAPEMGLHGVHVRIRTLTPRQPFATSSR